MPNRMRMGKIKRRADIVTSWMKILLFIRTPETVGVFPFFMINLPTSARKAGSGKDGLYEDGGGRADEHFVNSFSARSVVLG